jgi:hypothetical protein
LHSLFEFFGFSLPVIPDPSLPVILDLIGDPGFSVILKRIYRESIVSVLPTLFLVLIALFLSCPPPSCHAERQRGISYSFLLKAEEDETPRAKYALGETEGCHAERQRGISYSSSSSLPFPLDLVNTFHKDFSQGKSPVELAKSVDYIRI